MHNVHPGVSAIERDAFFQVPDNKRNMREAYIDVFHFKLLLLYQHVEDILKAQVNLRSTAECRKK
jgi:hypothetical protein